LNRVRSVEGACLLYEIPRKVPRYLLFHKIVPN
jgi:hypothetical protein